MKYTRVQIEDTLKDVAFICLSNKMKPWEMKPLHELKSQKKRGRPNCALKNQVDLDKGLFLGDFIHCRQILVCKTFHGRYLFDSLNKQIR